MEKNMRICQESTHPMTESDSLEIISKKGNKIFPDSPFTQWHLRKKYETMNNLFQRHLHADCRLLDIACGDGDALVLAKNLRPDSELWGVDINDNFLDIARKRVPGAQFSKGDMLNLDFLPEGYFDVVHEFWATCLIRDKEDFSLLARQYLRLVRNGGILLWEFPPKWSLAHLMYLLTVAPKITENDTKLKRIFRSFFPSKYTFLSDKQIEVGLNKSNYNFEIIEHVPIWYFYCSGMMRRSLDTLYQVFGDRQFELLDRINGIVWPRYSGFYLVIRKLKR
jgi:ubiquinone/menaquinone biosynthesis C-methylase UbiE